MRLLLALLLASSCSSAPQCFGSGICGCRVEATVSGRGNTFDAVTGAPVGGVRVVCASLDAGLAVSDSRGAFSFAHETFEMPGCGYDACEDLRFEDPSGAYETKQLNIYGLALLDGGVKLISSTTRGPTR